MTLVLPRRTAFAGPIVLPDGLEQARRRFTARAVGTAFGVQAAEEVAEIDLYDEIGFWGVTAADFKRQLRGIKAGTIRLNLNSPGGDVFDGIAIYNDLLGHPARIEVTVTGLAASAASLIAMAGDEITVAENAFLMIHNAWGVTIGDRNDHAKTVELLGKVDDALARTYAARSGQKVAEIAALMDADTWLTAEEAVDQGFADSAGAAAKAAALFDLKDFRNVPEGLARLQRDAAEPTARDAERALRDAGFSIKQSRKILSEGFGGASPIDDGPRDVGPDDGFLAACAQLESNIRGAIPHAR